MDILAPYLIAGLAMVVAFMAGAIFGAWVYAKGRERSSPLPTFMRRTEKEAKPSDTPMAADEAYEQKQRNNNPVRA